MLLENIIENYYSLLKNYFTKQDELYLFKAAELGKELVIKEIPPEEIIELHEQATKRLGDEFPDVKLLGIAQLISAPLLEILMSYGLSFREMLAERKEIIKDLTIAKEKAEESEKYLNNIINNIGDPVFVKDNQSRLLVVNEAFCNVFGLNRDMIIGKTLAEDVPKDEEETFLRIDKQVLMDGQENINEETLTVRGTETLTISTRKTRFIDSNGKKFLVGIIRDITEHKQAEDVIKNRSIELEKQIEKSDKQRVATLSILSDLNRTTLDLHSEILEHERVEKALNDTLIELKKSRLQLRELNSYVQNIRENERADISRELHDVLGQSLTVLKFDLSWIKKKITDEEVLSKLVQMNELIDEIISSVQRISTELRPGLLDDLGLIYALEWQCNEFEKRTDIKCTLKFKPKDIVLNEKISVGLFRIVQESLTNIARHAKAIKAEVSLLVFNNIVELKIKDNGVGIKNTDIENPKSLGLLGITERVIALNGKVHFSGKANIGTEVKVVVNLQSDDK